MSLPYDRYRALIENGTLKPDPAQEEAMRRLNAIAKALHNRSGSRLWWPFGKSSQETVRGLYLYGGVGRGKTLLMDIFFNNVKLKSKRRIHFHEFMIEAHSAIGAWRTLDEKARKRHANYHRQDGDDPIPPVARAIAKSARLLCFDEFQVSDIADAMILGRLFTGLFEQGVTVIATSNRHPSDLYKDGLNRQLFLPFIDLLTKQLDIFELQAERDYRLDRLSGTPVYYTPLNDEADQQMDTAWNIILAGGTPRTETLTVKGRKITISTACRGAARFTFDDLCARPLGSEDYIAIARRYSTIFIDRIPIMTPEMRNEARRFINLIDALYDHTVKLICSADAPPEKLYQNGDGAFEFERTASRLIEMQSLDYIAREHDARIVPASS